MKKSKSFIDSNSQKKNNFNKSIYTPSELERIKDNIEEKNNNKNLYQKHHRQLSYHLNYKPYLNNKEKETHKNNINLINNDLKQTNKSNNYNNINNNSLSVSKNEIIYNNKSNKIKSLLNSKSSPKIKKVNLDNNNDINTISKEYLTNINSNKDLSPAEPTKNITTINKSRRSTNKINSTVTHNINEINTIHESNINSNLNFNNQNKKSRFSSGAITMNNTAFSTINRGKNSLTNRQSKNINNNKINIPINNRLKYNNYNDDIDFLDEEFCDSNKLNSIPTNILIRLRDWLISCDLLCYYNLFIARNMYDIDSYIHDIQEGNISLTYKDIEKLGIRKPGHIFRILIRFEIDSGIIDSNLYNYIVERINYYSNSTTVALTSSINDINCCGINICSNRNNNINKSGKNKKLNKNNEIYFNDLYSFLKAYNLYKFKGNFIYNGFDKIEYIIIQLFSKYAFNKQILNDCFHIYIDKDKIKLLNKLYMVKFKIAKEFGIEINEDELNKLLCKRNKGNKFEKNKNKIENYNGDISNNSIKKSISNYNYNKSSSIHKSSSYYVNSNNSNEQDNNYKKENESEGFCNIF